jgi:hypothetical protein
MNSKKGMRNSRSSRFDDSSLGLGLGLPSPSGRKSPSTGRTIRRMNLEMNKMKSKIEKLIERVETWNSENTKLEEEIDGLDEKYERKVDKH